MAVSGRLLSSQSLVSALNACVIKQQVPIDTSTFPIKPSHGGNLKCPPQGHKYLGKKFQAIAPHSLHNIPLHLSCYILFPSTSPSLASGCQVFPAVFVSQLILLPHFPSLSPPSFFSRFLHRDLIGNSVSGCPEHRANSSVTEQLPTWFPFRTEKSWLSSQHPALHQTSPVKVMDTHFPQDFPEKFSHVFATRCLSGKSPECINIPGVY